MRKHPTEAESVLWKYLSGNKTGVHFRRQHLVFGYIPDFVSLNDGLIIEIDGGYHLDSEQQEKDNERTQYLNSIGYIVLRFTNEEVLCDIDNVLAEISEAIEFKKDMSPLPSPSKSNQSPLPLGGVGGGSRIGFGYDVHQLVEGRELWLGGIKIDHSLGLLGHSDADVLIHAICDALLGAACMRDIGYHFPDTAAETDGIDSKILLAKTMQLLRDKGYELGNIDATVCAERPKLNPHIPQMQQCLADVIGCTPDHVSIKATTTEKLGFTGRQEGISAYAVALITAL